MAYPLLTIDLDGIWRHLEASFTRYARLFTQAYSPVIPELRITIDRIHPHPLALNAGREIGPPGFFLDLSLPVSFPALVSFLIAGINEMTEIVAFTGLTIMVVLFLSFRYYKAQEELQPKWWYGMAAICMICHFLLAFLAYEKHPILAVMLFVATCGLSYVTCEMAVLHDRIQKRRGKRL